jgi:hypoxanthine-DNA glycosylase
MAPVGSRDARLLILGSLPGEASLAAQRYYAHPTNQFWRLLGLAIAEDLAVLDYDVRLERLAARDIALWDVVAEARRQGSLDGAISKPSASTARRPPPSAAVRLPPMRAWLSSTCRRLVPR